MSRFPPLQQQYKPTERVKNKIPAITADFFRKNDILVAGVGTGPVGVGTGPVGVGTGPVGMGTGPVGVGTGPVGVGTDPVGVGTGPEPKRSGWISGGASLMTAVDR